MTIGRKWTNSKGINFGHELATKRQINYLKKELGIKKEVTKKPYKKKKYNKK